MFLFVGPARAGLIVAACLLVACSGEADRELEGPSSSGAPASTAPPAPSGPPATGGSTSGGSNGSTSSGGSNGSTSGDSTSGIAVCEPDAPCRGITTCTNSCYGPDCCSASCGCSTTEVSSGRLRCSLSCNPRR